MTWPPADSKSFSAPTKRRGHIENLRVRFKYIAHSHEEAMAMSDRIAIMGEDRSSILRAYSAWLLQRRLRGPGQGTHCLSGGNPATSALHAGHAMSVPLTWSEAYLPIGTEFIARFGDEVMLFRLAGQLERARPWWGRRSAVFG